MHKRAHCHWLFIASLLVASSCLPQTLLAAPIEIAEIKRDGEVDFEKEILPIFRRNCLACHSATEAQSDLVLESPQTILKGGAEGPAVVAGKGSESRLLLLASKQKEPHMPPPDNDVKAKPLTPQELGLIKLWIDQGAKGQISAASSQIAWQPLPPGINPIYAVAISADGQYAAASRANQVFLVHVPSKRELGRLTDPALVEGGVYKQPGVADLDLVQSLKFSPDGTLLASGGFRTVKLWHKTVTVGQVAGAGAQVSVALGANQTASASQDGTIRIEEIVENASGKELKKLDHASPVTAIAVSPDRKRLASASSAGNAKLWDVESGKQIAEMKGDIRATLKVGEATRAADLAKKHIELAKKDLEDANGRKKAEDENKTKSGEALTKAETEFKPKEEAAKKAAEEKTAAEKLLADATAAKTKAEEAKKAAEELLAKAEEAVKAIKVSQEAAGKIDSEEGKAAKTAADKSAEEVEALKKLLEPNKAGADKTAEQAIAAAGEADKKVKDQTAAAQKAIDEQTAAQRTLDTAKRGVERANEAVKKATDAIPGFEALVKSAEEAAKQRDEALAAATAAAKESEKPIKGIAFSADGSPVVSVGEDGLIGAWDAGTGAALEVVVGEKAPGPGQIPAGITVEWKLDRTIGSPEAGSMFADRVTALDFSPDGKTLAVGSGEPSRSGEIKLFDLATGELKLALKDPHSDTVNCLAFSPDGKQLASCAADRFIKLWNVEDGKFVRSFEGHTHHVLGVSWRADGRVLVSSGADLVLKVWDARTGDQLRTVQNQFTKEVTSVSFVADDTIVASGGDSKVRFINSSNGNNQRDFGGTSEYMYSVGTSADGKTIIAGGLDSVLRIWNDQGQEWAKFAPPPRKPDDRTAAKE